jgi:hypothetical protein
MKTFYVLAFAYLVCQCSCDTQNNDPKEKKKSPGKIFPVNTILSGTGESGIAGYYNDWTIKISGSNYVEMLCSMKTDSSDTRSMNRQYFGQLIPSDTFDYRININKALAVDDCDEPSANYSALDTIPFHIDQALFNEIKYWDLEIKSPGKPGKTIRITSSLLLSVCVQRKFRSYNDFVS